MRQGLEHRDRRANGRQIHIDQQEHRALLRTGAVKGRREEVMTGVRCGLFCLSHNFESYRVKSKEDEEGEISGRKGVWSMVNFLRE